METPKLYDCNVKVDKLTDVPKRRIFAAEVEVLMHLFGEENVINIKEVKEMSPKEKKALSGMKKADILERLEKVYGQTTTRNSNELVLTTLFGSGRTSRVPMTLDFLGQDDPAEEKEGDGTGQAA